MYDYFKGKVTYRAAAVVSLEVGAIAYELSCVDGEVFTAEDDCTVYVHYHATEQKTLLYGFPTRGERDVFRLLLRGSGIGPQSALAILRQRRPQELLTLLCTQDKHGLAALKGIGAKTAAKLALELTAAAHTLQKAMGMVSPAVGTMGAAETLQPAATAFPTAFPFAAELRAALSGLGYKEQEIAKVITKLAAAEPPPASLEAALKNALVQLHNVF